MGTLCEVEILVGGIFGLAYSHFFLPKRKTLEGAHCVIVFELLNLKLLFQQLHITGLGYLSLHLRLGGFTYVISRTRIIVSVLIVCNIADSDYNKK